MSIVIDLTEAQFQSQVTELANRLRWKWLHVATTAKGYRSPMRGSLGPGWPDLILLRGHRMVIAELKAQKAVGPSLLQKNVLEAFSDIPSAEVYVWRPSDFPMIVEVLS